MEATHEQEIRVRDITEHTRVLKVNLENVSLELEAGIVERDGLLKDVKELNETRANLISDVEELRRKRIAYNDNLNKIIDLISKGSEQLDQILSILIDTIDKVNVTESNYLSKKAVLLKDLESIQYRVDTERDKIGLSEENMAKREADLMRYENDLRILDSRIRTEWLKLNPGRNIPLPNVNI